MASQDLIRHFSLNSFKEMNGTGNDNPFFHEVGHQAGFGNFMLGIEGQDNQLYFVPVDERNNVGKPAQDRPPIFTVDWDLSAFIDKPDKFQPGMMGFMDYFGYFRGQGA